MSSIFAAHGVKSGDVAAIVECADVEMSVERASECGLIVNELVSNSLLHAFSGNVNPLNPGTISVELRERDDQFELIVSDDGSGYPAESEKFRDSMGLSIVRGLVKYQLKGSLQDSASADATGTCFRIIFPRVPDSGASLQ